MAVKKVQHTQDNWFVPNSETGQIEGLINAQLKRLNKLRQKLHRRAELAFCEKQTAQTITEWLTRLNPDELQTGVAKTGIVARFSGEDAGPVVALRAEMDALPIQEQTGLAYASRDPNTMHACGHDGHMAIMLGLAESFAEHREQFRGQIKFIFQPAEEEGAGALGVIRAGVLSDVDKILAIHARPQLGPGQIELAPIPAANADAFDAQITGVGAHGAYPNQGIDAVLVASQIVCALQTIVSRKLGANSSAVVSVGRLDAGTARNIIAQQASIQGTLRSLEPSVQTILHDQVERIIFMTARAFGAKAKVTFKAGYPRVKNDPGLMSLVEKEAIAQLGKENVLHATLQTMGADDFGYYLTGKHAVPGCMIRLGVESQHALHTNCFDFGQQAIEPAILLLGRVALAILQGRDMRPLD